MRDSPQSTAKTRQDDTRERGRRRGSKMSLGKRKETNT